MKYSNAKAKAWKSNSEKALFDYCSNFFFSDICFEINRFPMKESHKPDKRRNFGSFLMFFLISINF